MYFLGSCVKPFRFYDQVHDVVPRCACCALGTKYRPRRYPTLECVISLAEFEFLDKQT
jgi:hypothetical protein